MPSDESDTSTDDEETAGESAPTDQVPSPPGGTGPGLVPAGDAPASQNPEVVDIDEHVLNEISSHAVAHDGEVGHDGQEVYATLYCNDEGLIRHSHIVEDETFLEKRRSSIRFKKAFYQYVQHLAQIYGNISHRLCGDVHSHPGGIPKQSPADKAFSKKVWNNPRRNHNFIVGLDDADDDGSDQWTVVEDGNEVQKRVNGHLIRVRAFAGGTNEPKQIRVHTTMGV
jgi:proteasome lid subunit RPN8/RPN11